MIRYHIPDFQKNFRLNVLFCKYFDLYRDFFIDSMEIEYIYDSFPLIWNGGRLQIGDFDIGRAKETLKTIKEMGRKVAFTFSNSLLTEEHLHDEAANVLMKLASDLDMQKSVIINSSLLEEYIRENYPDFSIILSTTRLLRTASDINNALKSDYELVVIDYNMNHNWDELYRISERKRCEFLINPCCVDECPKRGGHYRQISRLQLLNADPVKRKNLHDEKCIFAKNNYFVAKKNKNFISIKEIINDYEPCGFEHMKLEGRGGDRLNLLEQYVQYMAKPEFKDQVRFELLRILG